MHWKLVSPVLGNLSYPQTVYYFLRKLNIYNKCFLIKRTSSYLTFLGLTEGQHRLISEKRRRNSIPPFCDNDQYINNVFSFLLKHIRGKTLC